MEVWGMILGGSATVAVIEGIKGGIGWIVKRRAAKKDREEEKGEKKIEDKIAQIEENVAQIDEAMTGIKTALNLQKETSTFILYDRLRFLAKCFIKDNEISFEDKTTWNAMHECYHKNGGNGTMDPLAAMVNALPIKSS